MVLRNLSSLILLETSESQNIIQEVNQNILILHCAENTAECCVAFNTEKF